MKKRLLSLLLALIMVLGMCSAAFAVDGTADGDVPVGWDLGNSHISYLPAEYKDTGEILIETPAEGYVYQWVTIGENILRKIEQNRNRID